MKKGLKLLSALFLAFGMTMMVGCTKKTDDPTPTHTHTYATEWSKDATNHWHAANCEHTDEKADVTAHTWNDGEVTTQPTHMQEGVKTFTCTACGQTKTEPVAKLTAHTGQGDWKYDTTNHWKECECGEEVGVVGHSFDNGVETKAPTCTDKGVKTYSCECGYSYTEDINALGHNGEHHDAVAATLLEKGNVEYWYCDGCEKYYSDAECTTEITTIETDKLVNEVNAKEDCGVQVTLVQQAADSHAEAGFIANVVNNAAGTGLAIRVKNNTGIDTPIAMQIHDTDGNRSMLKTSPVICNIDLDGNWTVQVWDGTNAWRNNDVFVKIPANFDGWIYVAYDQFVNRTDYGANPCDVAKLYAVWFDFNVFYDAYADINVGAMAALTDNGWVLVGDTTKNVCTHWVNDGTAKANEWATTGAVVVKGIAPCTLNHHDEVPATCSTKGTSAYYECSNCHWYYSDAEGTTPIAKPDGDIDYLAHTLTKVDAVEAKCGVAGNIEYYECSECQAKFADAEGKNALADGAEVVAALNHNFVKVDAKAATLIEGVYTPENIEYYECSHCHVKAKDANGTELYASDDDSYIVKANIVHVDNDVYYVMDPVGDIYTDIFSGTQLKMNAVDVTLNLSNVTKVNDTTLTWGEYTFTVVGGVNVTNDYVILAKNVNTFIYNATPIYGINKITLKSTAGASGSMVIDLAYGTSAMSARLNSYNNTLCGKSASHYYTNTTGAEYFQIANVANGYNSQLLSIVINMNVYVVWEGNDAALDAALEEVEALFSNETYKTPTEIVLPKTNAAGVTYTYELDGEVYANTDGKLAITIPDADANHALKVTATIGEDSKDTTINYSVKGAVAMSIADYVAMSVFADATETTYENYYILVGQYKKVSSNIFITDGTNDVKLYSFKGSLTGVREGDTLTLKGQACIYISGSNRTIQLVYANHNAPVQPQTYAVEITTPENGTVTADKENYTYGETITLTITPDTNYAIKTVTVTNATKVTDTTYTCDGTGKVVVTVEFKDTSAPAATYGVTVVDTESKVTADKTQASEDEVITLTITPKEGYKYSIAVVNATKVTDTTYTCDGTGAVEFTITWVERQPVTVNMEFKDATDFSSWGTGYNPHTYTQDDVTVSFAAANHSTSTIKDVPVSKGGKVTIVVDDVEEITAFTFTCKQWSTKTQTITIKAIDANGTATTIATGDAFANSGVTTCDFSKLTTKTVKLEISFSSTSNQIGYVGCSITYK